MGELFPLWDTNPLERFRGSSPLFPLPDVVLFPGVLQPLHIFEPRYRQMVADAMESDRFITMTLLQPGYEADYEGRPPIHPIGCLGQIVRHEPLPDGRSNIVLHGLHRVRVDGEEAADCPYRVGRLTLLEDEHPPGGVKAVARLGDRILKLLEELVTLTGREADATRIAAVAKIPTGTLCDIACHCLGLDAAVKQSLLDELNVERRAATLLAWMQVLLESGRRGTGLARVPTDFSVN